jgi:2-polyprenyl-3-methyl-5-hydroxy-6-metoxy-1,4-benzoquinol methylase
LLWLNPMPAEDELGKLYLDYYTHDSTQSSPPTLPARIADRLRSAYRTTQYGYPPAQGWEPSALRHVAHLLPGYRAQWDFSVFYLAAQPNGRLLEIGCGNGIMLKRMSDLGWQVQGIDFDRKAVEVARSQGLHVHLGTLDEQNFPEESFDAVVMSHVIEHVPDPRALLESCRRVLKPDGQLMSITPNASSWGHRRYGADWYGLDPPRHLHVFTPEAMKALAEDVGLSRFEVSSVVANAHWILWSSRQLQRCMEVAPSRYSSRAGAWSRAMQMAEWLRQFVVPESGEEILLRATR